MFSRKNLGFSLVEVLLSIVIIGVMASVAVYYASKIIPKSEQTKLKNDIVMLNKAIDVFTLSGGNLDVNTGDEVLKLLKTKANIDMEDRIVGMTGTLINPKLRGVPATGNVERAVWDVNKKKFLYVKTGNKPGYSSFRLDSEEAVKLNAVSERNPRSKLYNDDDGWVWGGSPSVKKPISAKPSTGMDITTKEHSEYKNKELKKRLVSPRALIGGKVSGGGFFSRDDFPDEISLQNSNGNGKVQWKYANENKWRDYSGPISTDKKEASIVARVLSNDEDSIGNSLEVVIPLKYDIKKAPKPLITAEPPVIWGGRGYGTKVTISFPPEIPDEIKPYLKLEYLVNNDKTWQEAESGKVLTFRREDAPIGLDIQARIVSTNPHMVATSDSAYFLVGVRLEPPEKVIYSGKNVVGPDGKKYGTRQIVLKDKNLKGAGKMMYRLKIDGEPQEWQEYEDGKPIVLSGADYIGKKVETEVATKTLLSPDENGFQRFFDSKGEGVNLPTFGRTPIRKKTLIIVDMSGSMAKRKSSSGIGSRAYNIKDAMLRRLRNFDSSYKLGIIQFNDDTGTKTLLDYQQADAKKIENVVRGMDRSQGSTNYKLAFQKALEEVRKNPDIEEIRFLSDGAPILLEDSGTRQQNKEEYLPFVKEINKLGVVVNTNGYGAEEDANNLLKEIAQVGGGLFDEVE